MLNGLPALRPIKTIEARSSTAVPPGPLYCLGIIRIPGFKRRNAELIPYQGYPYLIFVQGSSSMIIVKKRNSNRRPQTATRRRDQQMRNARNVKEINERKNREGKGREGQKKDKRTTSEMKRNETK